MPLFSIFSTATAKRDKRKQEELDPVLTDLQWVDEFIHSVKDYLTVRLEDNLVIKRPNQAQKLNPIAAKLLKSLLDGDSIIDLFHKIQPTEQQKIEISNFLYAIRHQLEGKLNEFTLNPAVDVQSFTKSFAKSFSHYPVLSEIALTYRCNLKCQFCYAGCNCTSNPIQSDKEMKAHEVYSTLDKIYHEAKAPSVSFTGGEPTLVAELPNYIKYANRLGMRVNLITNGINVTEDYAGKLADHGLHSVQVSLEGVKAETHDEIVKMDGAFNKSLAALKYFRRYNIHTHTNTTLNRLNLNEAADFPRFIKNELGHKKFSMNLLIPTGSGILNKKLIVRYNEMPPYLNAVIAESNAHNVELMWYSPIPLCIFNTVLHGLGNKGCSTCDGLISVAANGDILPCASFDDTVGNILTDSFETIWQSNKAVSYRNKSLAHENCKACDHFHICNGACPLYWRELGYQELIGNEIFSR